MTRFASREVARRAYVVTALVIPIAVSALAVAATLVWGPPLDARVVIHWGIEGPDGWAPAWTYPVLLAVLGIALPALITASGRTGRRVSSSVVLMAATSVWLSVFLGIGLGGAAIVQPEHDDPTIPMLLGAALGLLAGALAWFLLPREPALEEDAVAPAPLPLRSGETAAWTGRVVMPPAFTAALAGVVLLTTAAATLATVVAGPRAAFAFIAPAAILIALVALASWRVTAGANGLTVRAWLGWPAFRVPAAGIRRARVVDVDPFAEFGGWGLRWAPGPRRGRFGVIVRGGRALEVERTDGRAFVVTIDDAETAAAVLNAAAAR